MTSCAVQLQQLNSIPLAVIRRQASPSELSRVIPECCGLVWNAMRAQQAQAGRHVAIYWDGSIRLEVGVELYGPFAEHGEVVRSATPAGAVASATHFGPYSGLGAAQDAVRRWCRANNHSLAGPSWEIYGHWQREWNTDPWQIRTDVTTSWPVEGDGRHGRRFSQLGCELHVLELSGVGDRIHRRRRSLYAFGFQSRPQLPGVCDDTDQRTGRHAAHRTSAANRTNATSSSRCGG